MARPRLSRLATAVAASGILSAALLAGTAAPVHAADSGLACTYTVSTWPGGFMANLVIFNKTATAINGWSASWNFQHATAVTATWNGFISQASPFDATGRNTDFNAVIGPGFSVALGWTGTSATADVPSVVTVNGRPCPVG
jgi:hypothetical protein